MEGFRGQVMRLTYWKTAKATFPRQFEEAKSEMRSLSESAEAWLRNKDPRTWLRAHFSTRCKSDLLLNNNSPMQWEHVRDMEPILPPIIRKPPGRPKQTRRKEVDEVRESGPKLSKTGQQANCTKCGKPGHNTKTCKWIVGGNQMESQSSSLQI
ncbi:hypothetical protein J1N35_038802 [Gossypium stocksii]|uniref:CCHC-type domain-containing protein n=1 Tax=Gossypium stocksii TaxID=47602 RepID=A0A9D3ZMZ6_9ROSI|nr:hypothetical protein J1N35_038802 [Gossypium stocksii]